MFAQSAGDYGVTLGRNDGLGISSTSKALQDLFDLGTSGQPNRSWTYSRISSELKSQF